MANIAIIAGRGRLPRIWLKEAASRGDNITVFALEEDIKICTEKTERVITINPGKLDKIIKLCRKYNINKVVMLGKVEKKRLFEIKPDHRLKRLLAGEKNLNDDSILRAIAEEFEKENIKVLPQSAYLHKYLAPLGLMAGEQLDRYMKDNMVFALKMAEEIGRLDIGQTVLVRDKTVIAVEAAEGTDKAIERAGRLAGGKLVMAKISKPDQDLRLDLPTIGLKTLDKLIEAGVVGLVVEAGKTFFIEQDEFLNRAAAAGIRVYGAGPGFVEQEGSYGKNTGNSR